MQYRMQYGMCFCSTFEKSRYIPHKIPLHTTLMRVRPLTPPYDVVVKIRLQHRVHICSKHLR